MTEECDNNRSLTDFVRCKELVVNNTSYLIGFFKKNNVRQVFLTNFTDEYYEEILSNESTLERCKELNPLLLDFDLEDTLDDLMVDIPKYAISLCLDTIKLKYKLEEGCFFFEIRLEKGDLGNFYKSFTDMIFGSLFELKHRYDCLLDIVQRKDKEIAEYKAQGVEFPRKSLITDVFTEKLFAEKLKSSNELNKLQIFAETINFYNSIKDLYKKEDSKEGLENTDDKNISQPKNKKDTKSSKRPSSDIRCAVPTQLKKKAKETKQAPEMKFL